MAYRAMIPDAIDSPCFPAIRAPRAVLLDGGRRVWTAHNRTSRDRHPGNDLREFDGSVIHLMIDVRG
jgi:hypothetical protein